MNLATACLDHSHKVSGMQKDMRSAVGALRTTDAATECAQIWARDATACAGQGGSSRRCGLALVAMDHSKKRQAIGKVLLHISRRLLVDLPLRGNADSIWCITRPQRQLLEEARAVCK